MTEILQALLTPLVAVVTTYIAYQQYRIRRDERTLVLYDRRLAVFKSAVGVLDRIRVCDPMRTDEAFAWLSAVAETQFLFGEEVQAVIDPLFGAVYGYAIATEPVASGKPFDQTCAEAVHNVELYRKALMEVFTPYLQPIGSPTRKRRLSLLEVAKLLPRDEILNPVSPELSKDVPF